MCGRYQNAQTASAMADSLGAINKVDDWNPSWNIRPTDRAPVALEDDGRRLGLMRWGWEPDWATSTLINARSDKLDSSRLWHGALQERRCVVPATGWWEWRGEQSPKTPYAHRLTSGRPFTFAGLWSREGDEGRFVIVVTDASKPVRHVRNRFTSVSSGPSTRRYNVHPHPVGDRIAKRGGCACVYHPRSALPMWRCGARVA
jgi:putative SOS response-associated peptidase YedK